MFGHVRCTVTLYMLKVSYSTHSPTRVWDRFESLLSSPSFILTPSHYLRLLVSVILSGQYIYQQSCFESIYLDLQHLNLTLAPPLSKFWLIDLVSYKKYISCHRMCLTHFQIFCMCPSLSGCCCCGCCCWLAVGELQLVVYWTMVITDACTALSTPSSGVEHMDALVLFGTFIIYATQTSSVIQSTTEF